METKNIKSHSFRYENGKIIVTGVHSVDNFDEKTVVITLSDNALTIKGQDFLVEDMNILSGLLTISGKLFSTNYHNKAEKLSMIKRLFK